MLYTHMQKCNFIVTRTTFVKSGFYYLFFAHVVLLLYEFIISVVKLTALAVGVSRKQTF